MRILKPVTVENGSAGRVSILCFGDIAPVGKYGERLSANSEAVFESLLSTIKASDLVFGNLECPLTTSPDRIAKTGPALRGPPGAASALAAVGFNILSTANNHILDCGGAGLAETLSLCEEAGISTVGAGENIEAATRPVFFDAGGVRVAFLAFADKEFSIATKNTPGAAPLEAISSARAILSAKRDCDFLVVSIHGGLEHMQLPTTGLRDFARFFVECGAQAVICHHAHVPGAYEIYREVPIFYSLGNTYMPENSRRPRWDISQYVRLTVSSADGAVSSGVELGLIEIDHVTLKIRHAKAEDHRLIELELCSMNRTLEDDDRYREALDRHYVSQRRSALTTFVPWFLQPLRRTAFGRRFLERSTWREAHKKLNILRCDAHREVLLRLVELEAERQQGSGSECSGQSSRGA